MPKGFKQGPAVSISRALNRKARGLLRYVRSECLSYSCHTTGVTVERQQAQADLSASIGPKSVDRSLRGLKPYRVEWVGEPGVMVASFESLNAAIKHIATLALDQQHVVIHRRRVVWPENVRREVGKQAKA